MFTKIEFTPDWISALAAVIALVIGLPSLITTIKQLVAKDTAQDEMIKSLSEQVQELAKQTKEFEKQTEVMNLTLNVYREMLSVSSKSLSFKEEEVRANKLIETEKKRRLIQPFFTKVYLGVKENDQVRMTILNQGKEAKNVVFKDISEVKLMSWYVDLIDIKTMESKNIELENVEFFNVLEGQTVRIDGYVDKRRARGNINKIDFTISFEFEDGQGNRYVQKISKNKENLFEMDKEPELLNSV